MRRNRTRSPHPMAAAVWFARGCAAALALAGGPASAAHAQADPETPALAWRSAIDSIFEAWNGTATPGCVCAVSSDTELLFEGAYGMANLELGVPLDPNSVFYVASVSKQFVAGSVALLSVRGELELQADARALMPELGGIGRPIPVRALAQHTSGLRDYFSLFRLAGRHELDHLDNRRVLRMLARQRSLEFAPGERYAYSNSNYVLLAELVERASGSPLGEFAERELFGPLGMHHTAFEDDHRRVVPGRVASYGFEDGQYRRFLKEFDVVGDGGALSTARDLAAWGRNLLRPSVGGEAWVGLMTTPGTLADGSPLDYGLGTRLGEVDGVATIGHTGSLKGFRTRVVAFPERALVVVVLCNAADANANRLSEAVARRLLSAGEAARRPQAEAHVGAEQADEETAEPAALHLTEDQLAKWAGHYWSDSEALARDIYLREGKLFYEREDGDRELVAERPDRFSMPGFGIPITFQFRRGEGGERRLTIRVADFQTIDFREYAPVSMSDVDAAALIGAYGSVELGVSYEIRASGGGLELLVAGDHDPAPLRPVMRGLFLATVDGSPYTLRFDGGEAEATGFSLASGLSHGLRFTRVRS
ncbi:MAG: serine hydrolase domain-containing protein [Gemmatimonadota bacterium]